MLKRFVFLVITAGVLSSILLLAGTAILDRVNAARDTGLTNALTIAREAAVLDPAKAEDNSNDNATVPAVLQPLPAGSQTVATVFADPAAHVQSLVTLQGIVTLLDDDEILLNDGTGQIIVDFEDGELALLGLSDGAVATITGKFELEDSVYDIAACSIDTGSGPIALSHCSGDDDNSNDNSVSGSGGFDDDNANSNQDGFDDHDNSNDNVDDDDNANDNGDDHNSNDDDNNDNDDDHGGDDDGSDD